MSKWCNYSMADTKEGLAELKKIFDKSIEQCGEVRIITRLDHVARSGMSRHITAFVPLIIEDETTKVKYAENICIAREKYIGGCGMDMGFELAYVMFTSVYSSSERPYQKYLRQSWL